MIVWVPGAKKRAVRRQQQQMRQQLQDQMRMRAEVEAELREAMSGAPRPSAWRTLRRLVFRGRKLLAPFVVLAVLGGLGAGAAYTGAAPAAYPALWLGAVAGWWVLRGRHGVDTGPERVYAAACAAGGLGWLIAAQVAGFTAVDQWLVLGWFAASTPWWLRHLPGDYQPAPAAEAVEESLDTIVERWAANIAASGRALTGATLGEPTITKHGEAYKGQAVPGAPGHTLQEIRGKHPQIAHGLLTPMERIVIDEDPDSEDPSRFRLQVIHRSPIKQAVLFDQPRWRDGRLLLGPYADGIDEAVWRLYSDNSMWGGHLLGGTGSGKTRVLELIALTVRAMAAARQPTTILYLDGQDGASSPTLWKHATWRGGPREADDFLAALDRGLAIRQKWNRLFGLAGFTPGASPDGTEPGLPGVLTIIDEQHRIFTPQNALHWANIAREGRKVGMAIIAADQYCDLEAFGGKDALRSSLLAGNGLALRTASRSAGNLIPGLELDPSTFPANLPGYGYKIAGAGSGERTAPFRARWLPDSKDLARLGELPVPTVEEWFARTSDAELDEMTARAFGGVFLRRHELAEAATEAARAEIEGRTPPPPVESAPAVAHVVAVKQEETPEEAGTTREQILALLTQHGTLRPVDLEEKTGKSKSSVKQALRALLEAERIDRAEDGSGYHLVEAAAA